jgi:hypothetical protein
LIYYTIICLSARKIPEKLRGSGRGKKTDIGKIQSLEPQGA